MQRESPGEADTMADVGGVELGETFADPSGSGSARNAAPNRNRTPGRNAGSLDRALRRARHPRHRRDGRRVRRVRSGSRSQSRDQAVANAGDGVRRGAGLRLLREAQAMARIDHPNVIRVHEAGTHSDQIYIAMEFADGGTLRQWLAASGERCARSCRVFAQAGRGLAAAHAAGLVHRDFKPDNVLLLPAASHESRTSGWSASSATNRRRGRSALEVPLSDSTPLSQDLTRTGALMGTPAFMAPEQISGRPCRARGRSVRVLRRACT